MKTATFYYEETLQPPQPAVVSRKYADALKVATLFFDIQKSGKLESNKISWRGDSALKDGSEENLDLSKGMYDAGDHMKFGLPLAFTATVMSWTILEYEDHMSVENQLESTKDSLKWITDYLINAHPSENVLYIQVGDPEVDHKCWNRPEDMVEKRPLTQVNTSKPGTEVAAETAAAFASASLVFRKSDPKYSDELLTHAKQLFRFADKFRESYIISIPQVRTFYNSTGFGDELLWAASWLYHATGDDMYFSYVMGENGVAFGTWGKATWFSWDDKRAGTQVLLSRVSFFGPRNKKRSAGLQRYRQTAEEVMCSLLPDSPIATSSKTDSGLIWVTPWNSLQHAVGSAFLAVIFSDYMSASRETLNCYGNSYKPSDLRGFAISQVDYILGNNPLNMSYLVGYGDKYPLYVHHRGASVPADLKPGCDDGYKWLYSTEPNPNIVYGALVGGPFQNDSYGDFRNNYMQAEPTTYTAALTVGLLSGLVSTSPVVRSFA